MTFLGKVSVGTTWGKPPVSCLGTSGNEAGVSLDLTLFESVFLTRLSDKHFLKSGRTLMLQKSSEATF